MKKILEIKDLKVKVDQKTIVSSVDLCLGKGEVQAILGPNAAGKSSLVKAIMGLSGYKINQGEIRFEGKKLNSVVLNKRVKLGIAMIFQTPPEIKGVKLGQFLKEMSTDKLIEFDDTERRLLARDLNVGFSGGEKKISELLQARTLQPKLLLIDEIDSGLDFVNLKKISRVIKKEFIDKGTAILLITHGGEIMKYLEPNLAHVMIKGKMVCSEPWQKVWQTIKKFGYQRCKKCPRE
mgnify:CR=1 FL=1